MPSGNESSSTPRGRGSYHQTRPVSPHDQAVYFNALPLLIVAASYLFVAALLGAALWRQRDRVTTADLALASIFPAVGIAAAIVGVVVLADGAPLGGHVWPPFVACAIALIPALAFLFRRQEERTSC